MKNNDKTREQLLKELEKSHKRIAELEKSETECKHVSEQNRKFNKIIETISQSIIITNIKGTVLYVNPSYYAFSGFVEDEVIGKSMFRFAHKKSAIKLAKEIVPTLLKKGHWRGDLTVVRKDKQIVSVDLICSLLSDEKNKPEFFVAIFADITERKKAAGAVQESEEKYRLLADNSIDAIWQMDLKLVFTYASPSVKNIFGYTSEEWVGTRLSQHTTTKEFFNMARKAIYAYKNYKKFKFLTFETVMLRKNGTEIPVEITGKLLLNKKGLPIGIQGITRDITERKLAELELAEHHEHLEDLVKERTGEVERSQKSLILLLEDVNEVNQELKNVNNTLDATNKELEAFSYSVSHDLRAPLTRMDGFSKALISGYSNKLDDQGIHFLNRISASSQHMARLINDLLSLSRITREKVTRQKVDMSQTAGKIAKELKASEPGRKVNFEIAKGLIANADRKFVIIILENLLGNTFKFTGKKKNAIIEFGKKIIDEDEVFFIKDNGAGFNMKYYNKIFTAFQRLHSDKEYKGTGIGLAIVQRIINKHGGKIWAESEVGEGTTFYFRFE
ncbi:MAG: PAS domain S-box protein [Bacteroidales bacterium]|nr:PAS domain S-box protein [Bacteroidales bacterium]